MPTVEEFIRGAGRRVKEEEKKNTTGGRPTVEEFMAEGKQSASPSAHSIREIPTAMLTGQSDRGAAMQGVYQQLGKTGWADWQKDPQYRRELGLEIIRTQQAMKGYDDKTADFDTWWKHEQQQHYMSGLRELEGAYQQRQNFYGQFKDENEYGYLTDIEPSWERAQQRGLTRRQWHEEVNAQAENAFTEIEVLEDIEIPRLQREINRAESGMQADGNRYDDYMDAMREADALKQELQDAQTRLNAAYENARKYGYQRQFTASLQFSDLPEMEGWEEGMEERRAEAEAASAQAQEERRQDINLGDLFDAPEASYYEFPQADWTQEEKDIFAWYYHNDPETAKKIAVELNTQHRADKWSETQGEVYQFGHDNLAVSAPLGTAASILTSPWGLIDWFGQTIDYMASGYEMPRDTFSPRDYANTLSAGAAAGLNDKFGTLPEDWAIIGGKGWGDAYQLANSIGESVAWGKVAKGLEAITGSQKIGSAVVNLAFFGNAASETTQQALLRGVPSDQAFWLGFSAGASEALFETISIESRVHLSQPGTWRTAVINSLKQAGVEASEEFNTTMANTLFEAWIMGGESEYNEKVRQNIMAGMTREEAENAAWHDWADGLLYDTLGGFLSGGITGGFNQGARMIQGSRTEYSGTDREALLQAALQMDQKSPAYALAQKIQQQGTMSYNEALQLKDLMGERAESVSREVSDRERAQIQQRAETALKAAGVENPGAAAQLIAKQVMGEELTRDERRVLKGVQQAEKVSTALQKMRNLEQNARYNQAQQRRKDVKFEKKGEAQKLRDVKVKGGKTATVTKATMEKGKLALEVEENGKKRVVSTEDLELDSSQRQALDTLTRVLGKDAAAAYNGLDLGKLHFGNALDMMEYATAWANVRDLFGYKGASIEAARAATSTWLTEEQVQQAYNVGKQMKERGESRTEAREGSKRGSGKISMDGLTITNEDGSKTTLEGVKDRETVANSREYKTLEALAKALDIDVVLFEGDASNRVNGAYVDGTIYLDWSEMQRKIEEEGGDKWVAFRVMGHELTHFIQQNAPELYDELKDFITSYLSDKMGKDFNELVNDKMQREFDANGRTLSYEAAVDEVIADACETMLRDSQAVRQMMREHMTLWEKICDFFDSILKKIQAQDDAAKLLEPVIEQVQEIWDRGLAKAVESRETALENLSEGGREIVESLGEDATVETDKNGDMTLAKSEDGHTMAFSMKTWDEIGRDKLTQALRENGHTQEEIDAVIENIEATGDFLEKLAQQYADEYDYQNLKKNLWADITTNLKTGKQVLSALVNNGDYPVNFDLQLICKKRVAYMRMLTRLIDDGIFEKVDFKGAAIADLNMILRDGGFETACLGCFVESRRLQLQAWAESIVREWNEEVDKRNPEAGSFDFAKGGKTLSQMEIAGLITELENAGKKNDKGNLNLSTGAVKEKMGRLLDKVKSLQQHLTVADLLTPQGMSTLRGYDQNLFSLVKQRYGANSPKIVQDFNPYNGEIADLSFKFVKQMIGESVSGSGKYTSQVKKEMPQKKGESKAEYNRRVETEAMRRYLYDIGGARIQSFSDFMIENVFDYMQIIADLSARKFPLHGYSKEAIFLRLFGMTGGKFNGSWIAHVDKSMGKEYAGLLPVEEASNGRGIVVEVDGEKYAICMDDYARHAATGSFIQSIGMKDMVALQMDPRYSKHVGSITIGVSNKQILAMLDSPYFRMVIPYHASGMIKEFSELVGVHLYNDYTKFHSTKVKGVTLKGGGEVRLEFNEKTGKQKVFNAAGKELKVDTHYDFNEAVQRLGDARAAANEYLAWCADEKKHPVYDGKKIVGYATFAPKFSDVKFKDQAMMDFSTHQNYYKLLEDFNSYDSIGEASALQGAVTMTLPSEANRLTPEQMTAYKQALRDTGLFTEKEIAKYAKKADMTFQELIAEEVGNRAEYESRQAKVWDETVDKAEQMLLEKYGREEKAAVVDGSKAQLSVKDAEYSDAVARGDMDTAQRMVDEAAKAAGYTVKAFHGTRSFGFTVFDPSRADDGISLFATSNRRTAETYSGETNRNRIKDRETKNADDLHGEQLIEEARNHKKGYQDYKLMSDKDKATVRDDAKSSIGWSIRRAQEFVRDHRDAFDSEKAYIMDRLISSLYHLRDSETEADISEAWTEWEDAVWDLKGMDDSIAIEFLEDVDSRGLFQNKNVLDDMTYQGDMYADWYAGGPDYIFDNQLQIELNAEYHKGIYELWCKPGKQLVFDANGENWNQITTPKELQDYGLYGPQRTRDIASAAKALGYDSVLMRNLRDNGGETAYNGISDVYIFFDASALKSADPVTYDDKGEVIPLSQRFDSGKSDIRYSVRGKYKGVEEAAIQHFGTTDNFRIAGYILQDGKMLDFSGAHWLDGYDEKYIAEWRKKNDIRQVDHEDVYEAFEQISDNPPSDAALAFINGGNIRVVPEVPGLELSGTTEPTAAQYRQIKAFIREIANDPKHYNSKYFSIDITKDRTHKAGALKYEGNINADRVINDIKHYYQTGEIREQGLGAFYSMRSDAKTDRELLAGVTAQTVMSERLQQENEILRESVRDLRKLLGQRDGALDKLRRQLRLTKSPELRLNDAKRMTRSLLQDYDSRADAARIAQEVKELGEFILGTELTGEAYDQELDRRLKSIARQVVENAKAEFTEGTDVYKEIASRIKGKKISVDAGNLGDLGDFGAFRKSLFGKLIVSQRAANTRENRADYTSADQMYAELQADYGETIFPTALNEGEELQNIARALELAEPTEANPFAQDMQAAEESVRNRVLMDLYSGALEMEAPTAADRAKSRRKALQDQIKQLQRENRLSEKESQRMAEQIYALDMALDKARSQYETLLREDSSRRSELENYKQQLERYEQKEREVSQALNELDALVKEGTDADAVNKQRARLSDKERQMTEALQAVTKAQQSPALQQILQRERAIERTRTRERIREGVNRRDLRQRVERLWKDMNRRITSPTEKKHIPVSVMQQAIEVLQALNMDTSREGTKSGEKLRSKLTELKARYEALQKDPDYRQAAMYDTQVAEYLTYMIEQVGDTPINKMSVAQLETVYRTLTALDHVARHALRLKLGEEERSAYEVSQAMTRETRSVPKAKTGLAAAWLNAQLSAERMFRRLGGYHKNSTWEQVYRMLNDGQLRQTQIQMEGSMIFADLLAAKDYGKFVDPGSTVDIGLKDEDGNPVKITHGMMVSLWMHLQNEQNRRHVAFGGLTIPGLKDYYNGKKVKGSERAIRIGGALQELAEINDRLQALEESDSASADEIAELEAQRDEVSVKALEYVESLQESIEKQLTDYDRQWIAACRELFDGLSKRVLNQTTLEVYGIKRANVENYFPIWVDGDFLNTPFETVARDLSLENAGFMKERVDSSKPIRLADVSDVAASQIRKVSQYAGLMPAIRNFGKVWGKTQTGYRDSLRKAVHETFGQNGVNYIEHLIADLNGARSKENDAVTEFFNRMRGHMAQASLTMSLRVAMGQTASYPTAAAVVGWKALHKALWRGGRNNWLLSRADKELIQKYSPLLYYRMKGYSNTELGDIAGMNDKWSRLWKKARWLTGWIQAMDGATVGRLWYAAEYYVQDHNKDLQKGTDAYYEAVAKVFNDIVERTQPNYSTMQRPDILRNPSSLVKQLTMFLTQRLQNFNILYDAFATHSTLKADYKAGRNGVTLEDVRQAATETRRACVSQVAAGITITVFKALADIVLHSLNAYRDDDDKELKAESISWELLDMFIDSMTGNVLGGSELWDIAESLIPVFNKTYYGIEVSGMAVVQDMISASMNLFTKITNGEATGKDYENVIRQFCTVLGIPYANGKKFFNAGKYWIQDAVNGEWLFESEAGVDRTTAMQAHRLYRAYQDKDFGKANKIRGQFPEDKQKDLDEAVREYIKDQYKAGDITVYEAMRQLQSYGNASPTVMANFIKDEYKAGNLQKGDAVKYLVEYAGRSQESAEKTVRELSAERDTGVKYSEINDQYMMGEISGQQATQMLVDYGGKDPETAALMVEFWDFQNKHPGSEMEFSQYQTYTNKYKPIGLSPEQYEDYAKRIKDCKGVDADGDGKTDSGSKKIEVVALIDSMDLTPAQKDQMYLANNYAESGLKDCPWNN